MRLHVGGVFRGKRNGLAIFLFAAAIAQELFGESDQTGAIHPLKTALRPGLSSFVIAMPKEKERTITVLNQNSTAEGRFSIAVSNRQLPADSPHWSVVRGAISFCHQRQFAVSLDGVEAKYVKLTFDVRPPPGTAKLK